MGFRNNAWAKVWDIEDKGNYSLAEISTSRKNKDSGDYETDFSSKFVRFIGDAHKSNVKKGERIQLKSCDVTTSYDKEKRKVYTNYLVFEIARGDGHENSRSSKKPAKEPESVDDLIDDDDLPF